MLRVLEGSIESSRRVEQRKLDRRSLLARQFGLRETLRQVPRKGVEHPSPVVQGVAYWLCPLSEWWFVELRNDEGHRSTTPIEYRTHTNRMILIPRSDIFEELFNELVASRQRRPDFAVYPGEVDLVLIRRVQLFTYSFSIGARPLTGHRTTNWLMRSLLQFAAWLSRPATILSGRRLASSHEPLRWSARSTQTRTVARACLGDTTAARCNGPKRRCVLITTTLRGDPTFS